MILLLGTAIAALGMCLLDLANQGQVTMAVLWDGMSKRLPISMGEACYLTSVVMIIFSLVYDRKQVRLGTVVHFIFYGWMVDLFDAILPRTGDKLSFVLLYAALGMLLLALGIGVYAFANLGRGPYEGICFALCEKGGYQMKYVRALCDGLFIFIGWILGGAVGIVTLVNIVLCGYLIQITTGWMLRMEIRSMSKEEEVGAERPLFDQKRSNL